MNTNPTKKKMPHSCTKKRLFEMYALDMSVKFMRKAINAIIRENRGFPKNSVVYVMQLSPKELQEFIDTYGLPRNYEQ